MAITNIKQWGFHGISLCESPRWYPKHHASSGPRSQQRLRASEAPAETKIAAFFEINFNVEPKVTRKIWNFYNNINSNIHDNHDSLAAGAVTVLLMNQPVDISGTHKKLEKLGRCFQKGLLTGLQHVLKKMSFTVSESMLYASYVKENGWKIGYNVSWNWILYH